MSARRRCLGCGHTYSIEGDACPKCGSHAAEVEEVETTKPKRGAPPRRKG